MSKITRFEDLDCWKAARILAKNVFLISQSGPLANDWDTRGQFRRAAVSIMNNIAEGFGRFSDRDSLRFYDTARASGNEVKSMLYLFEDVNYLTPQTLTQLHKEVDDALNLTGGFIRYIQKRLGE
jgi:four helix bundle protein